MKSEFTVCTLAVLALLLMPLNAEGAREKSSKDAGETVATVGRSDALESISYFLDQLRPDEDAQWKYGLIVVQDLVRAGKLKEAEELLEFVGGYRRPVACVAIGRGAMALPEPDLKTARRMLSLAEESSKGLSEWKERRAKMRMLVLRADLGETAEAEKLITQQTSDPDVLQAQMDIFGILDARAAAEDLEKFVNSKDSGRTMDATALVNAAFVLSNRGEREKAVALLKRAGDIAQTRIEPETISQLGRIARALQDLGQKEPALAYSLVADGLALKVSNLAEYKGTALAECVRLALALGDKERATALLEAAKISAESATYPYSAAAYAAYARACLASGKPGLAESSFTTALKDAREFPHPRARAIAAIEVLRCHLSEGKEPAPGVLAAVNDLRQLTGAQGERASASPAGGAKSAEPKAD